MQLVDTHCHVHGDDYPIAPDDVIKTSLKHHVTKFIAMGSNFHDSQRAIDFAAKYDGDVKIWAGVGLYPHETAGFNRDDMTNFETMVRTNRDQVAAIGEIGLDSFYPGENENQILALNCMLQLAQDENLPVSLHIRSGEYDYGDAFKMFWNIWLNFHGITGVLHSFTDSQENLEKILGTTELYVGVNGIYTFNKDPALTEVYNLMPLDRIVLETDAPWLAPKPYRGQTNQPAGVYYIAKKLASDRGLTTEAIAAATTVNALSAFPALAD